MTIKRDPMSEDLCEHGSLSGWGIVCKKCLISSQADEIERLQAEIEKLRAALEPFAVSYQALQNWKAGSQSLPSPFPDVTPSDAYKDRDFQRAHEALEAD